MSDDPDSVGQPFEGEPTAEPRGVLPWDGGVVRNAFRGLLDRDNPFRTVEVSCSITVNGEKVTIRQRTDGFAWDNGGPVFQEAVKNAVRQACALEVIKKFPPEVAVRT